MADTTEYAATFTLVDTDNDGLISAQELASLMRNLGDQTTDEQAAEVVRAMDSDGDERISLEEFARYMSRDQG
ncbi:MULTISPECIES: EF-hand domain-containing protein [unclassified Nocardiopsis]|jgi:Ca2+-binding EF-hand superfamily protein|uniref:EF-hand domain-containing protein n=1 Tax=unclassified Nocardiopsis TaxID=2649073 RepID=UPI00066E04DE|nr:MULTISPECIES: EF-hand domain-containing protein [unclassified Nocardiopsis]MBQ1083515.1 EF-hand domain-containing protein [Nocardiopsis sp. B62]